jgi:hypothetical protein
VSGLVTPRIKTLDLRTLADVTSSEGADRAGTITLGAGGAFTTPPCFELVPDAKRVYDLIHQTQRST